MSIHKSAEDYLETILLLHNKLGQVRSIDIVHETGYSKPSISVAMKKLREEQYIEMDQSGLIQLTEKGESIAKNIYEKHHCLTQFFQLFGVTAETAAGDACKIEHEISEETFGCLKAYLEQQTKD